MHRNRNCGRVIHAIVSIRIFKGMWYVCFIIHYIGQHNVEWSWALLISYLIMLTYLMCCFRWQCITKYELNYVLFVNYIIII